MLIERWTKRSLANSVARVRNGRRSGWRILLGGLVACLLAFGSGASATSVDGPRPAAAENALTDGASNIAARFAGLPQKGNRIGDPRAPITIVYYADIACPACALAQRVVVPKLIKTFVRTGRVKMVFRAIAFIGPTSERGALGAEAAARQDALWPFVSLLLANQGPENREWLKEEGMLAAATTLGLDPARWQADYDGKPVARAFVRAGRQAKADRVASTPWFVIRGPRGKRNVVGVRGLPAFRAAIARVGPRSQGY